MIWARIESESSITRMLMGMFTHLWSRCRAARDYLLGREGHRFDPVAPVLLGPVKGVIRRSDQGVDGVDVGRRQGRDPLADGNGKACHRGGEAHFLHRLAQAFGYRCPV